ncbi:lytic polysaccharide monooxygenase [Piedraia hortae CBS 480.64]|uniref:Lytic polysaccharide monooxygenase n=1 Tax=Piedraia hortae CBS 480.64 TaxID=1314780 RepID=A0A6A7CAX4_9PEZI|nr:lytic polysaccharide monooxygenase [Piedraia hortae CBS 480.64]
MHTPLILTLILQASAHLFISSPSPIPGTGINSPLNPSGSNFPCHGISLPTSGGQIMSAGSTHLLSFNLGNGANTAVHGGGSCQLSLTYETSPSKQKDPCNWFVIHSIEGGCPSNTHGNLDGTYTGPQGRYTGAISCQDPKANGIDCVNEYNFTIPRGVKAGHAILSWTWFNTVGNREMYQNCVNVEFREGDGMEMDELPTMFVGNLAGVDACSAEEGVDFMFPFPGRYVARKENVEKAAYPLARPKCPMCAMDGAPRGGGVSNASATTSTLASTQTTLRASFRPTTFSLAPPFANSSRSAQGPSVFSTLTTTQSTASAASISSGTCQTGSVPCSSAGTVCIGDDSFGICNNGCAVKQQLSQGTMCQDNHITYVESF